MPSGFSALILWSSKHTEREQNRMTRQWKQWESRIVDHVNPIMWRVRFHHLCRSNNDVNVSSSLPSLTVFVFWCAHGYQSGPITRLVSPQNKLIRNCFLQRVIVRAIHKSLFAWWSSLSTDCEVKYSKWPFFFVLVVHQYLYQYGVFYRYQKEVLLYNKTCANTTTISVVYEWK